MEPSLSRQAVVAIRVEMARQDITPAQLAERLGVESRFLGRRMRGDVPLTVDVLGDIAAALGVDPVALIARHEHVAA